MGCGFSLPDIIAAAQQLQAKEQQEQQQAAQNGSSPVYQTLPAGAEKFQVRNVYDGDTLTLVDERRVRFLGVDTPELKEQQPFAQEAKDYTKTRCDKTEIYLVKEGEDHYGRLLGWIYVEESDGGYLCVNEGLIQQGFAFTYTPKKDQTPFNWDKLLELQSEARTAKRGLWSSFIDEAVVATANGSAYHKRSCSHLSNIRNLTEMKISQATDKGLHPCRTCMG
jgi:micrococcal nuclease